MKIDYVIASLNTEFEDGRKLFQHYANSLKVDLAFQDFTKELKMIDMQYNKPSGALLLAYHGANAIGCAAVRESDKDTAELKRMFVLPEYRKQHIGKTLLQMIVDHAKKLQYVKIRLDTLPDMHAAQELYKANGFYEIPSYRYNPIRGTVYMEKKLI